jgi:hypothetical protein
MKIVAANGERTGTPVIRGGTNLKSPRKSFFTKIRGHEIAQERARETKLRLIVSRNL